MHTFMMIFAIAMLINSSHEVTSTGNVLILTMSDGISYLYRMANLAQELKSYGYNTTIVLPEGLMKHTVMNEFAMDAIVSDGMTKSMDLMKEIRNSIVTSGFSGSKLDLFSLAKFGKVCTNQCTHIARDETLMQHLGNRKFDIAIISMVFVNLCASVIPYKLSIPFIQEEFFVHKMRGLIHPAAHPAHAILPLTDRMTFFQRLYNTVVYILLLITPDPSSPTDLVGTFAPEKPHLTNEELQAKTELYLLPVDELIDYRLPTYPNMIYVGGLETRPATELTGELKMFMESADGGAVIVSMGSIAEKIPTHIKDEFMQAIRRYQNLKFVFKYGTETKVLGNVMLMPWIPQNDLLGHRNTKIFVSHCGLNALFEALYHAVPVIGLPLFGDQHYNALKIKAKGYGIYLNMVEFTADNLVLAINEILETPSYKYSIKNASFIFKSRPFAPAERAAWWVDHVIKYGGHHLRSTVATLPNYQFLLIDVLAGALVFIVILCIICFHSLKCIVHTVRSVKQKRD